MVKFRDHSLLVFQILLIAVDQSCPLVDDRANVIESLLVHILLQ